MMALHANGIALTFARTDTEAFQDWVFPKADSMLFIRKRLNFYTVAGTRSRCNGGAPSVLIAFGEQNSEALEASGIRGKHVYVNAIPMIVVGVSPSWKSVVSIALTRLNGEAVLKQIYDVVTQVAPDKIQKNKHYEAKIRQVLQQHFTRVKKGCYVINLNEEKATA